MYIYIYIYIYIDSKPVRLAMLFTQENVEGCMDGSDSNHTKQVSYSEDDGIRQV